MISSPQIWTQTSFFAIEPGEDQQTTPGCYGQAFAHWLAGQFKARGQPVQDLIPEDWGWCVMLTHKPYRLWIGCGNRDTGYAGEGETPNPNEWSAFVSAEPNIFQKIFSRPDIKSTLDRTYQILHEIMQQVPGARKFQSEFPNPACSSHRLF